MTWFKYYPGDEWRKEYVDVEVVHWNRDFPDEDELNQLLAAPSQCVHPPGGPPVAASSPDMQAPPGDTSGRVKKLMKELNMDGPDGSDRGGGGGDDSAPAEKPEIHEEFQALSPVDRAPISAVNFTDDELIRELDSPWKGFEHIRTIRWGRIRTQAEQIYHFLKMHPEVRKIYGNVMGDYTISHPLTSLIWYPNHEYQTLTLKGQALADTLEWLAVTPRMGINIWQNEPLRFVSLQVVDVQDGISKDSIDILLKEANNLRYCSLRVGEDGDDQGRDGQVIVWHPRLEVLHCYGGSWRVEGAALESIRELGIAGDMAIMGIMPNVEKLHISHHCDGTLCKIWRQPDDAVTGDAWTPGPSEFLTLPKTFTRLKHCRIQDVKNAHEVLDFFDSMVDIAPVETLHVHHWYDYSLDEEERDQEQSQNRDTLLFQLRRRGNSAVPIALETDHEWKLDRRTWLDGFYGMGLRRPDFWGLCTYETGWTIKLQLLPVQTVTNPTAQE